jgi:hypothetical protein
MAVSRLKSWAPSQAVYIALFYGNAKCSIQNSAGRPLQALSISPRPGLLSKLWAPLPGTNRIHLVLLGMQNSTSGPYLAAIDRVRFLMSSKQHRNQ